MYRPSLQNPPFPLGMDSVSATINSNGWHLVMGSRRECMCIAPKFLHFPQFVMADVIDWSSLGLVILLNSFILMLSWPKWPSFLCTSQASASASFFVTHSSFAFTLTDLSLPTFHSFPSST